MNKVFSRVAFWRYSCDTLPFRWEGLSLEVVQALWEFFPIDQELRKENKEKFLTKAGYADANYPALAGINLLTRGRHTNRHIGPQLLIYEKKETLELREREAAVGIERHLREFDFLVEFRLTPDMAANLIFVTELPILMGLITKELVPTMTSFGCPILNAADA